MKQLAVRPHLQRLQPLGHLRHLRRLQSQLAFLLPAVLGGCTPILDVSGVYFPGWLVSAVSGVAVSYGVVVWLGRWPGGRDLADSGLFFVGLVAVVALGVWWLCFSGF